MPRVFPVLVAVLLAVGLWLLPAARTSTLAAQAAHELMGAPVGAGPESGPDERPSLADLVLASAAVSPDERGDPVLRLYGVQLRLLDGGAVDPLEDPGLTRRSIVRGLREHAADAGLSLRVVGELEHGEVRAADGASFLVTLDGTTFRAEFTPPQGQRVVATLEGWRPSRRTSLLPPLVAICLAVLLRRPVPALCAGVFVAAYLARKDAGASLLVAVGGGVADLFKQFLWPELVDPYRLQIVAFVVLTMAMVGVTTASGGIRGLVELVSRLATSMRRTRVATWLLGLVVFFDDYANCILVGATMRPLTDRFRISREKLAYLVDSTAAPVAGLSIFSTWIAFEVSTFSAQLPAAGLSTTDGYSVFVQTLPYRFYCLLTLFLAGWVAWTGRDLGPMAAAERRAATTGQLVRPGGQPMIAAHGTAMEPAPGVVPRAVNALLPLLVFIGVTLLEIVRVGAGATGVRFTLAGLGELLRAGDSTRALVVGASAGLVVASVLALAAGLRGAIPRAAWGSLRSMGIAIVILYLAWMIGKACIVLGTAEYLTALLLEALFPELLPMILFLVAGVTAFATGTSWGTMSILLPLVVGLAYGLGASTALGPHLLMVMSIGAVLEGAIFGDHCSPISDTTVLSSTSSAADHIDHVRTQAPYALLTMGVALCFGYLPCALYGANPWLMTAASALFLAFVLRVFGQRVEAAAPAPSP
jgi:Na+/H+ antiporter NhaC